MILEGQNISIPEEGDSDFSRESDDKNYTKVVLDTEHNKEFIAEMREKLKNINNEEDAIKLKDTFKNMTGVDFDELCQDDAKDADDSPKPDNSNPSKPEPVIAVEVNEDTDDIIKSDKEYHEKTLAQFEEYVEDPIKLKFTQSEIDDMKKIGAFDAETLKIMVEQLNYDIEMIANGKNDPLSPYNDDNARRQAIKDTLEIKVRAQEAVDSAKEFTNSETIEKIFEMKFPNYAVWGPASILKEFLKYLERRTSTPTAEQFLYKEINSPKKLKEIIANAEEKLFEGIMATNGGKFTIGHFVGSILKWNRSRLAILANIKEEEVELKKFESVILIFTVLFVRSWYKQFAPNAKNNSLERKLFYQWMTDNANPLTLNGEKTEWLNNTWNAVWEKCAEISMKSAKLLESKN
jgi:hypothetical protein